MQAQSGDDVLDRDAVEQGGRVEEFRGVRTDPRPRRFAITRTHTVIRVVCALLLVLSWPAVAADAKPPLTTLLLGARAGLPDPNFRDSVVLVMNNIGPAPAGIIVNRPTRIPVARLFPDVEGLAHATDRVYFGGPVEIESVRFIFRADTAPERAIRVLDGVYLSSNRELLRKLLARDKPMEGLRIYIGYAGWEPGQLEAEIARGDWTLTPADAGAIFDGKSERAWPEPPASEVGRKI